MIIFNLSTDYAKLNASITDHNLNTLLSKAHNEKVKVQLFLGQEWIHCDPHNTFIYFCNLFMFFEYLIMLAHPEAMTSTDNE